MSILDTSSFDETCVGLRLTVYSDAVSPKKNLNSELFSALSEDHKY